MKTKPNDVLRAKPLLKNMAEEKQREIIEYGSTGAGAELVAYGPIELEATVERLRVVCAESGAIATPGTCEVLVVFGS